ncbi:hypothetical protein CSUB01_10393 [Colletotrichum sublineola]|uniref:Uncharacterized protein n=1 Tax=Colletotrichum sublineola TaxID=1173701 RepID=A0A066XAP2_COLSU|nr:hypothetical protein CSUB01_10393 [Colletotrichum sublineola]
MIFEVKGGGKSVRECEEQVFKYALAAIRHHGLSGIYVCTFVGKEHDILFACWVVDAVDKVLQPADHSPKRYTSLWSDTEHRLWLFWGHVKSHWNQPQPMLPPQNQTPSQHVYDPSQYVYGPEEDIYDAPGPDTYDQPNVYPQAPSLHNQPTQGQLGGQAPLPHEFTIRQPVEGSTVNEPEAEETDDEGAEDDEPGPPAAGPSEEHFPADVDMVPSRTFFRLERRALTAQSRVPSWSPPAGPDAEILLGPSSPDSVLKLDSFSTGQGFDQCSRQGLDRRVYGNPDRNSPEGLDQCSHGAQDEDHQNGLEQDPFDGLGPLLALAETAAGCTAVNHMAAGDDTTP